MNSRREKIQHLVNRFLSWGLPSSVCSDSCSRVPGPHRTGTNLLSADEARMMIEHVLEDYDIVPRMKTSGLPVLPSNNPALNRLIEASIEYVKNMSPAEFSEMTRQQAISWAKGDKD